VTRELVEALPVPVIGAVRSAAEAQAMPEGLVSRLRAVLLDDSRGAGSRSLWDSQSLTVRPMVPVDLFLAGGLDGGCVGEAIRRLRPAGVDVATGVESSIGVKDPEKMRRFIEAVREADRAGA